MPICASSTHRRSRYLTMSYLALQSLSLLFMFYSGRADGDVIHILGNATDMYGLQSAGDGRHQTLAVGYPYCEDGNSVRCWLRVMRKKKLLGYGDGTRREDEAGRMKRVFVSLGWGPGGQKPSIKLGQYFRAGSDLVGNGPMRAARIKEGRQSEDTMKSTWPVKHPTKLSKLDIDSGANDYAYQSDDALDETADNSYNDISLSGGKEVKFQPTKFDKNGEFVDLKDSSENDGPKPPLYRPVRRPPISFYPQKYGYITPGNPSWSTRPNWGKPIHRNNVDQHINSSSSNSSNSNSSSTQKIKQLLQTFEKQYLYKLLQQKLGSADASSSSSIDKMLRLLTHTAVAGQSPSPSIDTMLRLLTHTAVAGQSPISLHRYNVASANSHSSRRSVTNLPPSIQCCVC